MVIPLRIGENSQVKIELNYLLSLGTVHSWNGLIEGVVGIIIDGRSKPFDLHKDKEERKKKRMYWYLEIWAS